MASSTPPKRKRFLYKRAEFSHDQGSADVTLESLLKAAIKKLPKAVSRMEDGGDENEKRFINYHLQHSSGSHGGGTIYGCEFLSFIEGADQNTVELDKAAESFDVEAIPAGKDKEFLRGDVYFAVKGNHVILIQSRALRTLELETHLNWLLRVKTKVLDDDVVMILSDHVSAKSRKSVKGVRGIKLKTPLEMEASSPSTKNGRDGKTEMVSIKPKGDAWKALKAFVGDAVDLPRNFSVDDLANTPSLEVELFLRWKGRMDEDDTDFLDSIATQMRHVDDEIDYEVDSKHGSLTRNEIKVFDHFSVPWTDTGRPKFEVLFPKMADWLATLVADDKVDS